MKINEVIKEAMLDLDRSGVVYRSNKWQAIVPPDALLEITNRFYQMDIPKNRWDLGSLCQADLPWAENHFRERIGGKPTNPGEEYLNWPYYKPQEHDDKFKAEGEGLFSHTYQERFWPDRTIKGTGAMGYTYGNFSDVVDRLQEDPHTRQAFFAIWHPQDQANHGVRVPCTIGYQFFRRNDKLDITYLIRSCDVFRHFKNDIYLTARLAQYVAELLGPVVQVGKMSMWVGSLHCFNTERPLLKVKSKTY